MNRYYNGEFKFTPNNAGAFENLHNLGDIVTLYYVSSVVQIHIVILIYNGHFDRPIIFAANVQVFLEIKPFEKMFKFAGVTLYVIYLIWTALNW